MRILVVTASKHGSTEGIGDAIATELRAAGDVVVRRRAEDVATLEDADAVIIGSGVYAGRWLEPAKALVHHFRTELRQRPVWLFSSGPLDETQTIEDVPWDVAPLIEQSGARGHRVFAGRLAREDLGFAERAIINVVHAPYGDFRDWAEISAWAQEIAGALTPTTAAAR
jgi:menaquinone-dependent protoporphyrinogen oxidase